jgi:predicted amidohydrolase
MSWLSDAFFASMARGASKRNPAAAIDAFLDGLDLPRVEGEAGRRYRVAVTQVEARLPRSAIDYVEGYAKLVAGAVAGGARLVVFPELHGLLALGLLPFAHGAERVASALSPRDPPRPPLAPVVPGESLELKKELGPAPSPGSGILLGALRELTPFMLSIFSAVFSGLARRTGAYIMAGSTLMSDNGVCVNRAFLYGPDGSLVGVQDKVNLTPEEISLGLSPGSGFRVFETELGRLAMPVCMDASYFETFAALERAGAELALVGIANAEAYDYYLALRGIWPRVQESRILGLKSALVGRLFGAGFSGRAGVFAPLALTPDRSGVLVEATSHDKGEVLFADIDRDALAAWSDPAIAEPNEAFLGRWFPAIYGPGPEHAPEGGKGGMKG